MLTFDPNISGPFARINAQLPGGATPLLTCCKNASYGYDVDCFEAMVSLGADLTARDDMGRNCLHRCILYLRLTKPSTKEFEAIRYLVLKGANVNAVDNNGLSVSTYAYERILEHQWMARSSYAGDLWDSVLQSCGYDIENFRCVHRQRKARYLTRSGGYFQMYEYRRSDFEDLWRGREQFCPYWDDKPWPPGTGQDTYSCPRCEDHSPLDIEQEPGGEEGSEDEDESGSEDDSDVETDSNEGGARLTDTYDNEGD
ncbi:hypothetical protein PG990_014780 [Apiospora arundinis]|uniref:Ankyrin repeat-containing domain protein n=1 Tax=Apiospora arundinis TaxID=335852 RepID=A0ABR2HKV7_9PEZI